MARSVQRWGFALRSCAGAALVAGLGLTGCNKHDAPGAATAVTESTAPETPDKPSSTVAAQAPTRFGRFDNDDRLHQPFKKAVRTFDDPPPGTDKPVDETTVGKPTFLILKQVQEAWETIRFTTPDGKAIQYTAILDTTAGIIEIELRPDVAPNHVRNFVALARAGYYDGLSFDRMQFQESIDKEGTQPIRLEQIEAGNPRGVEPLNGTVGYWMLPEFGDKLLHEPGTVGACLEGTPDDEDRVAPDSAGCRFYVTLTKDPLLDGNYTAFGKVRTGLDVARRIYAQPVVSEDRERDGLRRPEKPVVITRVTIQTRIAEGAQ